jgi:hypothetical protein
MRKHLANKVQTPPSTPFPENFYNNETPNRIFQILDRKSRNLIFTWPDSDSINSYNKYDFSRLIWDSTIIKDSNNNIKKSNNLDVEESPNCLRLTSDKHIIATSGICRQVESVIIPYGDIVFACFQILPSATSTILSVSSAFKPKARSAPCSPATTINSNNNVYVKRPRSPGSLSPLPSSYFYDDEFKRHHNNNSNTYYNHHDFPDFVHENHRSKRHRTSNDQSLQHFVPIKISSSPSVPHLLLNPISPPSYHDQQQQQRCTQPQFSFSTTSKDHQPLPTIQHPQQPYYPHVTPTSQPRQPSPKHDYPSPTNHSQFHNITINNNNNNNNNNTNNNNMTQPQQPTPPSSSSQSSSNQSQQRYTQFTAPQQRRNNNNNNSNNNNNNNNNVQGVKKCESCHTSSSPEWRRGPTGHKT